MRIKPNYNDLVKLKTLSKDDTPASKVHPQRAGQLTKGKQVAKTLTPAELLRQTFAERRL